MTSDGMEWYLNYWGLNNILGLQPPSIVLQISSTKKKKKKTDQNNYIIFGSKTRF